MADINTTLICSTYNTEHKHVTNVNRQNQFAVSHIDKRYAKPVCSTNKNTSHP